MRQMESSDEDDDFTYHEGITPQSKINSLYQSNTEKGIRKLCCELLDLKDAVENLCGNARAKHLAFLRLSEEVVEMEHELSELRKHISSQRILVQDLMSGLCQELAELIKADGHEDPHETQSFEIEDFSCKDSDDPFLEKIDVLLCENKVLEALEVLDLEEKRLLDGGDLSSAVSPYKSAFLERKAIMEEQLIAIAVQNSLSDTELKKTVLGLLKLGKGLSAHQIVLKRFASSLHRRVEAFIPSCFLYPATYSVALSKITFSYIGLAAKETASTFGDDPVYKNKMVQWAEQELEYFVRLVKENGPSSDSITALHAANVCVQASLSNCVILESHGLMLSKLLMVLLRPYMEEVLEMNFRRARRLLLNLADNDDDPPLSPRFLSPLSVFVSSSDSLLISSAMKFIVIVKEIVELLMPPAILHFGGSVLTRISHLFDNYVDLLTKALPSLSEDDGITELKEVLPFKAETDSQQLTLLGVAYSIVDEVLPMAVSRIWTVKMQSNDQIAESLESNVAAVGSAVELKDWRRQLQHSLDKLRDYFCRQYVLNFIYSREGKARLDATIYVDGEGEDVLLDSDPLPSLPFQALFGRLQQLATVAGDVLLGKEKLQKVVLARLTETIVMWLSDEQDFWGVFEDDSVLLKPRGLQQLILDMHFTVEIANFAGYSSRNVVQSASEIIIRAVKTFSARGIDPQSTLPEEEWFSDTAKAAINKLLLGASGSEASEAEDEPIYVRHHVASAVEDEEDPVYAHHHLASDSDDSISCPSTVDSFHSFVSAEMDELENPSDFTGPEG